MPSLVSTQPLSSLALCRSLFSSRTDLRPTASHGEGEEGDASAPPATTSMEDATATAAFNESTRRNRRSRILHTLNIGRMTTATPEERLAALRMLRNEQMIGDSTPRARNRFSQRLSRTFGSRPQSGSGTPRRNSGIISTAETLPTAEVLHASEMESTAEEPLAAEEAPPTDLSITAEVPPAMETPQVQELSLSQEKLPNIDTQANIEEKRTAKPLAESGEASAVASTVAGASDNQVAVRETARLGTPASTASASPEPGPPSQPNIAPFYSYR